MDVKPLELLTTTIVSGVLYDILKTGALLTVATIKKKIHGWLLDDTELAKIADQVNAAPDVVKRTPNSLEAFLEGNQDLRSIINGSSAERMN
jgi:hypothetical protein